MNRHTRDSDQNASDGKKSSLTIRSSIITKVDPSTAPSVPIEEHVNKKDTDDTKFTDAIPDGNRISVEKESKEHQISAIKHNVVRDVTTEKLDPSPINSGNNVRSLKDAEVDDREISTKENEIIVREEGWVGIEKQVSTTNEQGVRR
mmetsp:Transcript_43108/g.69450  ORF Transcript_43108/g.69450 Transcript_43108/m.69450 type:complete len:147 (-) Transcript_43108:234-674(-)|eukprot:jgi/Bigna1/62136/fgenesh1_kg.30_\